MADGSIVFETKLDNSALEKELNQTNKKIFQQEAKLSIQKEKHNDLLRRDLQLRDAILKAQEKLKALEEATKGKASPEEVRALYEQKDLVAHLQREFSATDTQLKAISSEIREANNALDLQKRYAGAVTQALQSGSREMAEGYANIIKDKFGSMLKVIRSGISGTVKTVGRLLKTLASGMVQAAKKLNVFSKLSDALSGKFKRLGNTIKSALVFSVIYKGLGKVKEQMAQYLSQNAAFTAAAAKIKGALLTAFQPIYDVVVPALTTLMNILARVIITISQFTSALFGTTGKQAQANAKALNAQAKATENAGDAADKAQKSVASFDEINQLSAGSSAGGGGAEDAADPAFDAKIEDTVFSSWGEAFSAFLDNFLNNGLPKLKAGLDVFAARLNVFAQNLLEMFTFPGVLDKVRRLGVDLALAFNDLVNNIDWATLGAALGSGLNLAVQFLVSYLYSIDWLNFGSSLAGLINNAISNIDWRAVGQLLFAGTKIGLETLAGFLLNLDMMQLAMAASSLVTGFMDSVYDTLASINWQQIGQQVKNFLVNVDWAGVAKSTFRAIGAAFGSFTAFLWGLIKDAWAEVIDWWHETAYKDGEFTLLGLLEGIWNVMKSIGTWINENIFQPFINGFKSVFGIHSPSTVMIEMGKYLMEGLLSGIQNNFKPLLDAFKKIMNGITNFISGVFSGDWQKAWNGVKDIFAGIWNGIVSLLESAVNLIIDGLNWLISQMNRISFDVPDWVPLIGGKTWGINIPTISRVEIPRLAQGAVIPPNREFMAVLGDQKQGTNIEAPLETIIEAIRQAFPRGSGTGDITVILELDKREFGRAVVKASGEENRRMGVSLAY